MIPAALDELLENLEAERSTGDQPTRVRSVARPAWPTRRKILVGAGAAGVLGLTGGGFLLYRDASKPKLPPEVEALMTSAEQLQQQNIAVGQNQAIGLYERVVKLAPEYADGWGKLGVAYGIPSHYRDRPEAIALRAKAESAGNRALELEPDNVYGELALAVALPFIGNWAEWDRRLTRALAKEPKNDELLTYQAVMLQFEGRPAESVPLYQRIQRKPFTPAVYTNYIRALWSAGRLTELDEAMEDAASLYPSQASIWSSRFNIMAYGGRTDAAIALVETPEGRPAGLEENIAAMTQLARAIQSRDPAAVDAVMAGEKRDARKSANQAELAIRNASALGRLDEAFSIADAYYFARGYTIPDYDKEGSAFSPEQRQTRLLFEPVTRPMRADSRFERLVAELGFDRYWKQSGRPPDYRRA